MRGFRSTRPRSVIIALVMFCAVAGLGFSTLAWGQSNQGSIAGTILDPSGAAVGNADITAVGASTGSRYHTKSTDAGIYNLPGVSIGTYNVTVLAHGFKTEQRNGVEVLVGSTTALNIALQVGAASETVTVESNAPSVQTETNDIAYVLTPQQQLDLPLPLGGAVQYMREPEAFVFLAPGTVGPGTSNGSGGTFESKISGGQDYSTEVLLDGASQYRSENGSSFSETAPSVEALTEFKLSTSTLPAYLGRTTGGVESFSTKAGTNEYHGDAYDILANTDFDANNWGNNLALALIKGGAALNPASYQRVPDKQNDYGLTLGGPLWIPHVYNGHNRTFFFFSWEQFNLHSGGVATDTVPTTAMRGGDFSSLLTSTLAGAATDVDCNGNPIYQGEIFDPNTTSTITVGTTTTACRKPFAGNKIPSGYVPTQGSPTIGANLLSYYPSPLSSGLSNNLTVAYPFNTLATSETMRFDQNLVRNQKLYFSYNSRDNVRPSTTPIWNNVAGDPRNQDFTTHYMRFGYDLPLGNTMLNHLNLGYNRTNSKNVGAGAAVGGGKDYDTLLGIKNGGNGGGVTFPNINATGLTSMGDSVDGDTIDNGYRFNETFDWIKSKHTLKFGYDYRFQVFDPINYAGQSGTINFNTFTTAGSVDTAGDSGAGQASLYLGLAGYGTTSAYVSQPRWIYSYWALFAQDDWKLAQTLTLNLGLRYDVDVPRREAQDDTSDISLTTPNPGAGGLPGALVFAGVGAGRNGVSKEQWANTWRKDWGPRVGFSWSPRLWGNLTGRTVVHGGYGIYYAALTFADFGADMLTGFQANPTFSSGDGFNPAFNLGTGFPAYAAPPSLDPTQLNLQSPTYIDPSNGRPGMTQNWSTDIQEQVAKDMIVDVGYVGTHATHTHSGFDNYNSMLPGNLKYGEALFQSVGSNTAGIKVPYTGYPTGNSVGNALRPRPQYYNFNSDCCLENKGQSSFEALEISAQRRWRDNLNLLAAYTWSKTLTDADSALPYFASSQGGGNIQNPFNSKGEKALSNQDTPQVLTISYLYQLPFGKGKAYLNKSKALNEVVGGWQIGGIHRYQSGQPISFGGAPTQVGGFDGTFRYNRVSGQPLSSPVLRSGKFNPALQPGNFGLGNDVYNPTTNPNPYRFFNYAALTDPNTASEVAANGGFVFGDMTRTTGEIRSYKYLTEDFSFIKNFPLYTERLRLQLKGEMIDAFNRHIFNRPNTDGPSDFYSFGYVNPQAMDNGNVLGEPGDGGPRRVQFTLKAQF
jgi:Carboxypeptidase regulatory-like domain